MGVTIKYKDSTIASMNATGSKTLKTGGKYCEGDIDVEYVAPTPSLVSKNIAANGTYAAASDNADGYSEVVVDVPGIVPSGSKSITANGVHDVSQYASADVDVPVGVFPSGSLNITENGTYDVTDKAQAVVAVPVPAVNAKCFVITIAADQSGKQVILNPEGDSEIGNHRNDATFCIGVIATQSTSAASTRSVFVGNNLQHTSSGAVAYGYYLRSSSSGLAYALVAKKPSEAQQSAAGTLTVDANGVISVFASSSYPIKAGDYIVVCGW